MALGRNEPDKPSNVGALVLMIVGASAMVVGGAVAASASVSESGDQAGAQQSGAALFALGATAFLVSVPWFLVTRGVQQKSATTEFEY